MKTYIPLNLKYPTTDYSLVVGDINILIRISHNSLINDFTIALFFCDGKLALGSQLLSVGINLLKNYAQFNGKLVFDGEVLTWSLDE